MGFDVSATHTVFFIAAIILAAGTIGVFNQSVQKFTGDVASKSDGLSRELTAEVRVVNDPARVPNNPVILYVLNTGTSTLAPTETIVVVDGQVHTALSFDVLGTSEDIIWRNGQVLMITLDGANLANGDHRVKVIGQFGAADTIRFSI